MRARHDLLLEPGDVICFREARLRHRWTLAIDRAFRQAVRESVAQRATTTKEIAKSNAILPFAVPLANLGFHPMSSLKPNEAVRQYLSKIGKKGGKTVTPKKLAHLAGIQSKGGQTVTPKKLASLARARAARLAKSKKKTTDLV